MMKSHPISDIQVVVRVKEPILDVATIRGLIFRAAIATKIKHAFSVNVQVVGLARSLMFNKQWRGKDKPTNVLSFAAREGEMPRVQGVVEDLGDIVICPAVAKKEAALFDVTVREHIARLIVHGFLHLVGHDHEQDADASKMEKLEWKIVRNT
jgi:probable rRNA maturation factor